MIWKPYLLCIFLSFLGLGVNAQNLDSLQRQADSLQRRADSLQKRIEIAHEACVKVDLYTSLADSLIQFNQPETRVVTDADAAKAVDYVLKAIHINAKNNDTLALRYNFDCLAQAYFLQKKYTEAKWFILQSNSISRDAHDVPHIIYSLRQMAIVKTANKEYALALKDLNEAIVLAKYTYNLIVQIEIEKQLATVYDSAGDTKQALAMQQHYSLLAANLKIAQTPRAVLAMQKAKLKAEREAIAEISRQKAIAQYNDLLTSKINIENGIWAVKD